jgi:serine/threonine protein phosphatase PrpC
VATDGIWDKCEDSKAVEIVLGVASGNNSEMAKALNDYAVKEGTADNSTVIVIRLS